MLLISPSSKSTAMNLYSVPPHRNCDPYVFIDFFSLLACHIHRKVEDIPIRLLTHSLKLPLDDRPIQYLALISIPDPAWLPILLTILRSTHRSLYRFKARRAPCYLRENTMSVLDSLIRQHLNGDGTVEESRKSKTILLIAAVEK